MKRSFYVCIALGLMLAPALLAVAVDGGWLSKVPANARTRVNPLHDDAEALAAGAKLFQHDCASCHGVDARGLRSHPALTSERVHNATDGELEWLLKNGSMARGMPSWSRLPEAERWQLVRYLHTLSVARESP